MFLLENRTWKATNKNLAFLLTCEHNSQVVFPLWFFKKILGSNWKVQLEY